MVWEQGHLQEVSLPTLVNITTYRLRGLASQQSDRGQPIDVEIWYVFPSRHAGDPSLRLSLLLQSFSYWIFIFQTIF